MLPRVFAIAAIPLLAAQPANAFFVDFTDTDVFPAGPNAAVVVPNAGGSGVTLTISGTPQEPNFNDVVSNLAAGFCNGTRPGLALDFECESDGAGIGGFNPDEVDGEEMLTVSFSQSVEITAIYLLDFFFDEDGNEIANVDYMNGNDDTFVPEEGFALFGNGFAAFTVNNEITSVVKFTAGDGNDNQGVGDYALAGIEFNLIEREIPVPAALPLLLTGIAGLALYRRRRAA
ncbi:hypothetical protein LNKW23_17100 [Paralimibaculum aggregatum]|uniref:Secreted protein n=1 Tax=Paralimibaculum aggregatum TaxID=3036245 RepID=A0ABQ6LHP3_9RHOB|nr:VPLPA-CTERM sorting domain-containing protein [Limibaculum sp. NKW23]GMG82497.1 hypothetical protein LNKW23_17100 [Limibaculum sp. NKW23]